MRVLVCGSQDWQDASLIRAKLHGLGPGTVIVHGACNKGADRIADEVAKRFGYVVDPFPADWSVKPDTPSSRIRYRRDGTPYDKAAGVLRTREMYESGIDLVFAFQLGRTPGTQFAIDEGRRRGVPVDVSRPGPHIGSTSTTREGQRRAK